MYEDDVDWTRATNSREAFRPSQIRAEAKLDLEVSKILGKPVLVNDPKLIALVVKWKKAQGSSPEVDKMDRFLYNPDFLVELRKTFAS